MHIAQGSNILYANAGCCASTAGLLAFTILYIAAQRNKKKKKNTHGCKAQDTDDNCLGPLAHIQTPHHEDGQCAKGPVRNSIDGRGCICGIHHNLRVNTAMSVKSPPGRDGVALEQDNPIINCPKDDGANNEDPDDPDVQSLDRDPEQEDADRHLEHAAAENIEHLAEEPISQCFTAFSGVRSQI